MITKICPKCGETLTCKPEGGCWCADLPHIMPLPSDRSDGGCMCLKCLQELIDARTTAAG
ncbi:MAG: hypothetical protein P4K80_02300 [Acidobacteriaceae bacterium]|nr:hypothetical protein [Acidobacteriaceae bacterium]